MLGWHFLWCVCQWILFVQIVRINYTALLVGLTCSLVSRWWEDCSVISSVVVLYCEWSGVIDTHSSNYRYLIWPTVMGNINISLLLFGSSSITISTGTDFFVIWSVFVLHWSHQCLIFLMKMIWYSHHLVLLYYVCLWQILLVHYYLSWLSLPVLWDPQRRSVLPLHIFLFYQTISNQDVLVLLFLLLHYLFVLCCTH